MRRSVPPTALRLYGGGCAYSTKKSGDTTGGWRPPGGWPPEEAPTEEAPPVYTPPAPAPHCCDVQLTGGLKLTPTQLQLVELLFQNCSRTVIAPLAGGLSGSLVLTADSYDADSQREEPTVLKLDKQKEMAKEVERTKYAHGLVDEGVIKVIGKPKYLGDDGALQIEMAGACWVMPEFYGRSDTTLVETFKVQLLRLLAPCDAEKYDAAAYEKCHAVLRELWAPGGTCCKLSLKTAQRAASALQWCECKKPAHATDLTNVLTNAELSEALQKRLHFTQAEWDAFGIKNLAADHYIEAGGKYFQPTRLLATAKGGFLAQSLTEIGERVATVFLPPDDAACPSAYSPPASLKAAADDFKPQDKEKHNKKFGKSFVHDPALASLGLWSEAECQPLADLLTEMRSAPPEWLSGWHPLLTYQHNDLNTANVLVDLRGATWLIDFARSKVMSPWTDTAQMIARLLFQTHQIPLTMDDVRTALKAALEEKTNLLKHTLELNSTAIEHLEPLVAGCADTAQLAQAIRQSDSEALQSKLLPYLAMSAGSTEEGIRLACSAVARLVAPAELSQMAACTPDASWPEPLRLTLRLCTHALDMSLKVIARCSAQEQSQVSAEEKRASTDPADLHPAAFLLALLKCSLEFLRYPQLSSGQKRVVCHTVQRLAAALSAAMPRAPAALADDAVHTPIANAQLREGQPLLMLSGASSGARLAGGEGETHLAMVSAGGAAKVMATGEPQSIALDTCRQLALPGVQWTAETSAAVDELLRDAQAAFKSFRELSTGTVQHPSGTFLAAADDRISTLRELSNQLVNRLVEGVVLHAAEAVDAAVQDVREKQATINGEVIKLRELRRVPKTLTAQLMGEWLSKKSRRTRRETKALEKSLAEKRSELEQLVKQKGPELQLLPPTWLDELERQVAEELRAIGVSGWRRYEACAELVVTTRDAPALQWRECRKTADSMVLTNAKLSAELQKKLHFTQAEWDAMGIEDLAVDHCIEAGGKYFQPAGEWWRDVSVVSNPMGVTHVLKPEGGGALTLVLHTLTLVLHPWNHAPRLLPSADFEVLRKRHARLMASKHAAVADVLSGKPLNVFDQCVPIKVAAEGKPSSDLRSVSDVAYLARWLQAAHAARCNGDANAPACILLSGQPASGKTCLMSQLVMHTLRSNRLVPILIKVQHLQRYLLMPEHHHIFANAWNWVDAHLQCEQGSTSDAYLFLRQAMLARCALILLDGIDEGGEKRDEIERHVTEMLAPQGHVMLITSRPHGLKWERFRAHFHRLMLCPLTEAQQKKVIEQRVLRAAALIDYVEKTVPLDTGTGHRVTGNPLMLSMVISIFESRDGASSAMPKTVAALYGTATKVMLERANRKDRGSTGVVSEQMMRLLQRIFFEAQADQGRREIQDRHLEAAARHVSATLHLESREEVVKTLLHTIRERVVHDALPLLSLLNAEPLQMQSSHLSFQEYFAARVLCEGEKLSGVPPWKWRSSWTNTVTIGMGMGDEFSKGLLRAAGIKRDALNLSKELSPEEDREAVFLVVRCLASVLASLDLSRNSLGSTGGAAVAEAIRGSAMLTECNVRGNDLDSEVATMLAKVAAAKRVMLFGIKHDQTKGNFSEQGLGPSDGILISSDVQVSAVLTSLDLSHNRLDAEAGKALASALIVNTVLSELSIAHNSSITGEAAKQLAAAALTSKSLEVLSAVPIKELREGRHAALNLSSKGLGPTEGIVLAKLIKVSPVLTDLSVAHNSSITGEAAKQLAAAALTSKSLEVLSAVPIKELRDDRHTALNLSSKGLGPTEGIVLAKLIQVSPVLTDLNLAFNNITNDAQDMSAVLAIAEALKSGSAVLNSINLQKNALGPEGGKAMAVVLTVNTVLIKLNLDGFELNELSIPQLRGTEPVQTLHVSSSPGVASAIVISKLLESNTVLTKLNLDGFELNIPQLRGTEPIQTLDLSGKRLLAASGIVMAKCLESNTVLTSLNLQYNVLGAWGAKALAEALTINSVLTDLSIAHNNLIPVEAAEQLAAAALNSKSLEVLSEVPIKELREDKHRKGRHVDTIHFLVERCF